MGDKICVLCQSDTVCSRVAIKRGNVEIVDYVCLDCFLKYDQEELEQKVVDVIEAQDG